MPKISVIVPVYKVEQYLDRCVESILAQTFTDFELILVDDGSPDNCSQMCDDWAKKDARIRVIHKQNEGVSKARNDAVLVSKGELLTFVDSDDWLYPEYLEVLYTNLVHADADISVCMVYRKDKDIDETGKISIYDGRTAVLEYAMLDDAHFRSCLAKLIKRDILFKYPFPTDRTYSEDMAVIYKWYYSSNKVVGVEKCLYYYFINEVGATFSPYGLHRLGDLKTWNELIDFLKAEQFLELYSNKIIQYANALCTQYNQLRSISEYGIAKKVKKELKKICKSNPEITYETASHIYNTIYPIESYVYWTSKGIISKIKRK